MDKSRVNWFALETILQGKQVLAFDHVAQIQHAWKKLRAAVEYTSVVLFSLELEFWWRTLLRLTPNLEWTSIA